jgi:hypothetical protein
VRVWLPITKLLAGFAVRICEPTVMTGATTGLLGGVMAIVLPPTAIAVAPGARLTGVPETVIWGPPATSVWLPTIKSLAGFAVRVCDPRVMTGAPPGVFCGVIAIVLPPTAIAVALGAKLIGVPETVIWGPPGLRVWEPIMKLLAGFAVIVFEPTVITGGLGEAAFGLLGGIAITLVPIAMAVAPGARLIGVSETVIPGPPGLRVWEPMTKLLAGTARSVSEPTDITGGLGGATFGLLGGIAITLVPIAMAVAPGARLIGVSETVIPGPPGLRVWESMM